MEVTKITAQQTLEIKDVICYLEALTRSFESGAIVVEQGDDFVNLALPNIVEVNVEVKAKKDKFKFSLELAWRAEISAESTNLTITDKLPQAQESGTHDAGSAKDSDSVVKSKSDASGKKKTAPGRSSALRKGTKCSKY